MVPVEMYERYHPLATAEEDSDSLSEDGRTSRERKSFLRNFQPHNLWKCLAFVFALSISNIAGFLIGSKTYSVRANNELSPYLNLQYSHPSKLWWNTEYSAENASLREINKLWDVEIPWESGIIALTVEEAQTMNLPESQPFPWDASQKRIYIINAHHILHCIRNIYISIQQYRTDKPQTIEYQHILHCLDSLRVEAICTADDTPRYVPLNSAHGFRPGDGQQRQCREWAKVQAFVETHDSCYRYLKPGDKKLSNLERFKFCPQNSKYLPKIRKYFGYEDNWTPELSEGPKELEW